MTLINFITNLKPAKTKTGTLEGKKHIIAPTVMLTEGVHNGSMGPLYYSKDEIENEAEIWNHMPIVVYHPTKADGSMTSARQEEIINTRKIGILLNTVGADGKLSTECWIDEEKVKSVDKRVYNALKKGTPMEVSTGLNATVKKTEGIWNNEKYEGIVSNFKPDHLAILPDKIGACSLADGAGLLVNEENQPESVNFVFSNTVKNLLNSIQAVYNGKEMSFSDISRSICDQLANTYGQPGKYWQGYIVDIFPDKVVFRNEDDKLYQIEYTANSTEVKLSGKAVEIKREIVYTPVKNERIDNMSFDKNKHITDLIANGVFTEAEKPELEKLPDAILSKFSIPKKEVPVTKVENTDKKEEVKVENKEMTLEELFKKAPPKLQEVWNEICQVTLQKKTELVSKIVANQNNAFTKEELDAMPIPHLEKLAKVAAIPVANNNPLSIFQGNYAGAAIGLVPPAINNAVTEKPLNDPWATAVSSKN